MDYIIEMLGIRKEFSGVIANDNITFQVKPGEIHALLGENGAGKSTLMSVLFGLYQADEGVIRVRGQKVKISGPQIANSLGIGMVHQHFKLVHNFTVTENIILGREDMKGIRIDIKSAAQRIEQLSRLYKLNVDPYEKVEDISVGMQQRVEILKMLYRKADILIFDEPTAVLTPQEINELIEVMKSMKAEGKTIILITHKLKEIKQAADRCTIIRKGKSIKTVDVATTSQEEMAELMVGRRVSLKVDKAPIKGGREIISVNGLNVKSHSGHIAVKDVSFSAYSGEILGIAGVEGNGQSELIEALTGLCETDSGCIKLEGRDITNCSIRRRIQRGLGHIPEDRHKHGLVLDFSLSENIILKKYNEPPFSNCGILNDKQIRKHSADLIGMFDIRCAYGPDTITRTMSGGNQQKAIIAREIDASPSVLIVAQPTRGLDVGAIEYIHRRIVDERNRGSCVILFSLDLDEILRLSDRIAVMYGGKIVDIVKLESTDENSLGMLMAGVGRDKNA